MQVLPAGTQSTATPNRLVDSRRNGAARRVTCVPCSPVRAWLLARRRLLLSRRRATRGPAPRTVHRLLRAGLWTHYVARGRTAAIVAIRRHAAYQYAAACKGRIYAAPGRGAYRVQSRDFVHCAVGMDLAGNTSNLTRSAPSASAPPICCHVPGCLRASVVPLDDLRVVTFGRTSRLYVLSPASAS
jgi:hypothetical protein